MHLIIGQLLCPKSPNIMLKYYGMQKDSIDTILIKLIIPIREKTAEMLNKRFSADTV